jgi:hypothetical protein
MKKLILIGDGLFQGTSGYKELLEAHLILAYPKFAWDIASFTKPDLTYEKLFDSLPMHVIGKAPEMVLFALGYNDILCGTSPDNIKKSLMDSLTLVLDKTQATVIIANCCSVFFKGNEQHFRRCMEFNQVCHETLKSQRISIVDLDTATENFLNEHRAGKGEKRSLHHEGPRLTVLGALLVSRIVAEKMYNLTQ